MGATGMLGGEVLRQLLAAGHCVRALTRPGSDEEKLERLRALGVETITGDLRDAASLDAACHGVHAVICTASSIPLAYAPGTNDPHTTDRDGVINLIDALRAQAEAATDPLQKSFGTLMLDYANDQPVDMREALRVFPLTLSTVEEYAQQVTAAAPAGAAASSA